MPYRPTMMNARLILAEEPIHSAASTLTDPLARAEPKPQDQVALQSIAQALTAAANLGKQWRGNCGSVCLADRRLAVLAHYSPKNSASNLFFFPLPCSLASRLLQWRLLRLALTLRTTVSEMASTAFELLMVAASMLTALQPPIVICHSERACE
jgi:hypothetical protein